MTATHGVGTYGNAAGTVTPLDHKMAQLGPVVKTAANTIRAGLFWDGNATIVSGKANMSLDVRAFTAVLSRGATAGAVLLSNDSVLNKTTDVNGATLVAPGSNSVYWNVFVWQREYSIDGTDSNPVIGVLVGTPAASPTVPALTSYPGAVSLATVLVPAGTTATNSGTTITQTAPFTTTADGLVTARTTTERDAYVPAAANTKARCWVIADGVTYQWNGAAWKAWESDWISYTATLASMAVGTGGGALNSTDYKWMAGRLCIRFRFTFGTSGTTFPSTPTVTIPSGISLRAPLVANELMSGRGTLNHSGSTFLAHVRYNNSDVDKFGILANAATSGGLASITTSVPFTWAAGDSMVGEMIVDVA